MFEMGAKFEDISYEAKKVKNIKSDKLLSKKEHNLVFKYEKRKGKPITLVGEFYLEEKEKKAILKLLKTKLACGGTIKDTWIELQGDIKDKVKNILIDDSWKFKK